MWTTNIIIWTKWVNKELNRKHVCVSMYYVDGQIYHYIMNTVTSEVTIYAIKHSDIYVRIESSAENRKFCWYFDTLSLRLSLL